MRRGWKVLSDCYLCKQESEIVLHIFVNCLFCRKVWSLAMDFLGIKCKWGFVDLEVTFTYWFNESETYRLLPIFISWSIWTMRNNVIFQNLSPNVLTHEIKWISLFKEYMNMHFIKKTKRLYYPGITTFYAKGFFMVLLQTTLTDVEWCSD